MDLQNSYPVPQTAINQHNPTEDKDQRWKYECPITKLLQINVLKCLENQNEISDLVDKESRTVINKGYEVSATAKVDIQRSSLIVPVPRKIMMNVENVRDRALWDMIEQDKIRSPRYRSNATIFLLLEKFKENSMWKAYVDSFSGDFASILIFHDHYLEQLKENPTLVLALRQYEGFYKLFEAFNNPANKRRCFSFVVKITMDKKYTAHVNRHRRQEKLRKKMKKTKMDFAATVTVFTECCLELFGVSQRPRGEFELMVGKDILWFDDDRWVETMKLRSIQTYSVMEDNIVKLEVPKFVPFGKFTMLKFMRPEKFDRFIELLKMSRSWASDSDESSTSSQTSMDTGIQQ